jgi:predicted dehydrogenase
MTAASTQNAATDRFGIRKTPLTTVASAYRIVNNPFRLATAFASPEACAQKRGSMNANPVKLGIVGLGRWAKVLTRAAEKSDEFKIVSAYSRSEEKRQSFEAEFGIKAVPDLASMLEDRSVEGVILTVPNEQHLPVAAEVARAGKHVYTEKPIASTLEEGLQIAALQQRYGITVTVGHSARLMGGIRRIRQAIDQGELGRVAFIEANFSNERALELTPQTWRWYKNRAPGGPLSQLAIHQFDVLNYLGGEVIEASSMASKLSPVGAEVDDQSMTLLKFTDGKIGYVGSCWTSPGIFSIRVFGSQGLMHYEIDFGTWDVPEKLHETSTLYIQRGKNGYANREELKVPESDMFRAELELFAESCRSGQENELSAGNGNAAVAIVYAALRSIEENGRTVRITDVIESARRRVERSRDAA